MLLPAPRPSSPPGQRSLQRMHANVSVCVPIFSVCPFSPTLTAMPGAQALNVPAWIFAVASSFSALSSHADCTLPDECQSDCVTHLLKTHHWCPIACRTKSRLITGSPAKLAPGDFCFPPSSLAFFPTTIPTPLT